MNCVINDFMKEDGVIQQSQAFRFSLHIYRKLPAVPANILL